MKFDPHTLDPQRQRVEQRKDEQVSRNLKIEWRTAERRQCQIPHDCSEARLTEKQPADHRHSKHRRDLEQREPRRRRTSIASAPPGDDEQYAVVETPQDIVPARAVPETR